MCFRRRALWARAWAAVAAKAESSGVTKRVKALWVSSGVATWLETCAANVEKRRRNFRRA